MQGNIEHQLIENESVDDQSIDVLDSIDGTFDATVIQDRIEAQARRKADKILKKNKREIERLKKHAGECLIKNEKFGYCYAIKKLRDIYKQPYTEELIDSMWNSSRAALLDIAHHAAKQEQK